MRAIRILGLIILILILLAACDSDAETPTDTPSVDASPQPALTAVATLEEAVARPTISPPTVIPTTIPTFTPTATATRIPPTTTPEPDPGPYFTPFRDAPDNPTTFTPPEQVADFMRFQMTGSCRSSGGLLASYRNEQQGLIYLQCQFMPDAVAARQAVQNLRTSLSGEPIMMGVQGDHSFMLAQRDDTFIYAWTHGAWFFMARSLNGRLALDDFMTAFPH